MGLLREIVLLPVAPVRTVAWTLEQVLDEAQRQQLEDIRRGLSELEQKLQAGEISEEEFDREEDHLLDQLEELEPGLGA